jgi:glycosyltransferase involved in cell wall biosynthesis
MRRLVTPLVDRFVAASLDLTRWLIETVGIPRAKVLTIPNGVDTHRFSPHGRSAARRALGLAEDSLIVGAVARLDAIEDSRSLFDAFARLSHTSPDTRLLVIGDGPARAAAAASVRALAPSICVTRQSHDVAAVLPALDVYVLSSAAEGVWNAILEAMAAGLPVVATRTGGNAELVVDGVTGSLVPVGDAYALATTLRRYVTDGALRDARGRAGRRHVEEHFRLDRMRGTYRSLYEELGQGLHAPRRAHHDVVGAR